MLSEDRIIDSLPIAAGGTGSIPVVDLAAANEEVVACIAEACREWGLFLVTGHGFDVASRSRFFAAMRQFFALSPASKRALSRTLANPWGYNDRELTKTARDRKEIFDIGPEACDPADPFLGSTPWPAGLESFAVVTRETMATLTALTARLTGIVAAGLGEKANVLTPAFRPAPTGFLRLNRYPAADPLADLGRDDAGRAVHHHTDAGALTILIEDGKPGLQVLRAGHWHNVTPLPGALVVNIGDMIEVWSNGRYRAPLHRVLATRGEDRLSAAYFYNPAYGAEVSPLPRLAASDGSARFRPVAWAEFRRRRAEGDYGDFGREVQIADYRSD